MKNVGTSGPFFCSKKRGKGEQPKGPVRRVTVSEELVKVVVVLFASRMLNDFDTLKL